MMASTHAMIFVHYSPTFDQRRVHVYHSSKVAHTQTIGHEMAKQAALSFEIEARELVDERWRTPWRLTQLCCPIRSFSDAMRPRARFPFDPLRVTP
jgi:hypothetical protein